MNRSLSPIRAAVPPVGSWPSPRSASYASVTVDVRAVSHALDMLTGLISTASKSGPGLYRYQDLGAPSREKTTLHVSVQVFHAPQSRA